MLANLGFFHQPLIWKYNEQEYEQKQAEESSLRVEKLIIKRLITPPFI